ncbi:MAG TPA: type II secretion system F family protein [Nocardioidaceae bacterium]|nr:type II secretion system F family protein [Nocardioidaceae bacterium]
MGLVVGLASGVGILLIWSAFSSPVSVGVTAAPRADRLRDVLDRAGLESTKVRSFVLVCMGSALLAFLVLQVVSRTTTVALVFGALAGYLPVAVIAGRARARQRELAEVWPDAVDNLASAVRAGMALPEALSQLGDRGPAPLRPAFGAFTRDYQSGGRFGECLDRLKERLSDPVGDRVVEGLRIAREVGGGDLGRVLRNLSAHLRDDARTRAELESRQAWAVNGARLAVAAPWLVLLMLCFDREVIARYATGTGLVVLLGGAALCLVSYRLMLRIGRLPTEQRVLR